MVERRRRYFLKAKEAKELLTRVSQQLNFDLNRLYNEKTGVEVVETEDLKIFLINKCPVLVTIDKETLPTLLFDDFFKVAPKITVDMGAVPHVCKGANVMAPGIRSVEGDFKKGDLVFVIDEKHGKPLALGKAEYNMEEARKVKQGIVVHNAHFVGDKVWDLLKELPSERTDSKR